MPNLDSTAENPPGDDKAPRVFISYSHDSKAHKNWVASFSAKLISSGVQITLDQWDCLLGQDITLFMEQELAAADRVIVVCTDKYINRANEGSGGVGYERMIISAEIVRNLGTRKFIPVIRNVTGSDKVPRCLGARKYVDLSDGADYVNGFDELLRDMHNIPPQKPPPGQNPFVAFPDPDLTLPILGSTLQMMPKSPAVMDLVVALSEGATADLLFEIEKRLDALQSPTSGDGLAELRRGKLSSGVKQLHVKLTGKTVTITSFPFFVRSESNKPCPAIELQLKSPGKLTKTYEYRPMGNLSTNPLTVLVTDGLPSVVAFREQTENPRTLVVRICPQESANDSYEKDL